MPWRKAGETPYHAQLGLLRQRSCNQRVCCLTPFVVYNKWVETFGQIYEPTNQNSMNVPKVVKPTNKKTL